MDDIPIPDWLREIQPGDPIEITIRGILTEKVPDTIQDHNAGCHGHLQPTVRYGDSHERTSQFDGPGPVYISWPPPAGLTIKGFVLTTERA